MQNIKKEQEWLLKEKYHGKPNKNYNKDLKRLNRGEPLDYVIGFCNFLGCKIDLSKKPLIPRPETEYWAGFALEKVKEAAKKPIINKRGFEELKKIKVLDIFSGSGCLGVAVLANAQNVNCDFTDKNPKAIAQIKINLKNNFINFQRYSVIRSDVFSKVKGKYDFILANPPYIAKLKKNKIQKSVLKYEPKDALFGGADGFKFINKFLKNAKNHLNADGQIFMEIDFAQKKGVDNLLKKYKYKKWEFSKDQYGKWRWVVVK